MRDIIINKELKALIPPLASSEYNQLEENILAEGCRDPLVVWSENNTLIDGHNRKEICDKHNIPYKTDSLEFASLNDVKVWMIDNQKGRRNLSDGWKYELAQAKKKFLEEKGREIKSIEGKKAREKQLYGDLSTIDKTPNTATVFEETDTALEEVEIKPHNTREEISKDLGWSTGKVAMADKVWTKADEETKEKIKNNDLSINQAYQDIRKKEKKEEREKDIQQQIEDIETGKIELPQGKFEVLAVDPPWNYGTKYSPDGRRVANPYPEMTQDELLELDMPSSENSIMFLWTTHKFIFDAKELLEHWGFTYRSTIVWDKEKIGMGDLFRMQCEFCLVGIKGKPMLNNNHTHRDIIKESRREHSRKPDAFYEMVNELCLGRKLEYFSREKREGWEIFGNDLERFDEMAG